MNRRTFTRNSLSALGLAVVAAPAFARIRPKAAVRLGGPIFSKPQGPEEWAAAVRAKGFRAAYCPLPTTASAVEIQAYESAAKKADIVIAEVGAWSNPISPDANMAREAMEKCIQSLHLAERIGANCCVNISGSKNAVHWAGPHRDNLTQDTFDQIVEVTRKIIDAVKPKRTFFALEPMPWAFPDSADSYLDLIRAIDRKAFGVHMDPMNLIVSPRLFYDNANLIRECFKKLGAHIRSCHAKDIDLRQDYYMPQFSEVRPGLGQLDYQVFLQEVSRLADIPLMMEHLSSEEEYDLAAAYIRAEGLKVGVSA
ncbi:Sugar phosphate isomerase/epimerase [Cyclobacterium xiamenense]|uniref:Sugar phosphate isomerase/epimerase n=1 Tax=Cyclobacterium xiamenense TaxID=1297121 RepID=A0A1H6XUC6_9BACT|nr:sugar phosphate isomerase/epimerase [Cyclobacterium xiamenense]SEJ28165.1 Sugar phosphate isomerase/epimerase [Cyclobacterium xiamenense]